MKSKKTHIPQNNSLDDEGLPYDWKQIKLSEISELIMGQSPPGSTYNNEGVGIPFFQGKTDFTEKSPVVRSWCTQPKKFARSGDILISVRAPVGPTNVANRECAIGRGLAAIRPKNGIPTEYILYFLKLKEPELALSGAGSTFTAIKKEDLAGLILPLPPLAEQQRIVARVEALLAHVNTARDRLSRVPLIIKRFRQAVLAAACSGRLTEGWREENHNELEPRNNPIENVDLFEIPTQWQWILLPKLGYMKRGRSKNRPRNAPHLFGGKYPFIQTGDISQSGGRLISHHQTYNEDGLAQSKLWPEKTVCITIAANIAESALLTYPACFPDSVVGFIADEKFCLSEYVEYFIRLAKRDLSQFAPATAQKNINIEILNEVAVPLPPLVEQHEIIRRVGLLFERADAIGRGVVAATKRTEALTQAVLGKAFSGKL